MGSGLKVIFLWFAQAFILLKSLFKLIADKFILSATKKVANCLQRAWHLLWDRPKNRLYRSKITMGQGQTFVVRMFQYCTIKTGFKKSARVLKRLPDTPFWFNLKIRSLSRVLHMSKNADRTSWPSLKNLWIWCVIDWSWVVQDSPGLEPDWISNIKLFSVKNLNILSHNNLWSVLPETGSKEMGR